MIIRNLIRVVLVFFICAVCSLGSFAQEKIYGLPYVQNYGQNDHERGVQNWGAVQDQQGRMYFGNTSGVLMFDGHYWSLIRLSNSNTVRSLDIDDEGIIYVGGVGDLGFLELDSLGAMSFHSLTHLVPEEFRSVYLDAIFTLATDQGVFFVGTRMIFHYVNGEMKIYEMDEVKGPFNRAWEVNGKFYTLRPMSGLYHYNNGELELVPGGEMVKNPGSTASGLLPYNENELLFIDYLGNTVIFGDEGGRVEKSTSLENLKVILSKGFVTNTIKLPSGDVAFSSENAGVFITDENFNLKFNINKKAGLFNDTAKKGFIDKNGNYWVPTSTGISYIILNNPITVTNEKQGLDNGLISLVEKEDTLFIGTSWGVKYEDGGEFKQIPNSQLEVWDLDVVNSQLYASAGGALQRMKVDGTNEEVKRAEPWGLIPLKEHPGKYILHCYQYNLLMLEEVNGKLKFDKFILGYVGNARKVVEDKRGHLWITDGRAPLVSLEFNTALDSAVNVRQYGKVNGLPTDEGHEVLNFESEDGLGFLVLSGDTYYQYEPQKDTFLLYQPLANIAKGPKRESFTQAKDGTIYTASNSKKIRYVKTENGYQLDTLGFGKINHLPFQDTYELSDSTIMYLTSEGLMQFHPKWVNREVMPYHTVISNVRSGEKTLYGGYDYAQEFLEKNSGLTYENNSLRFSFSALFFEESNRNTFSYRLEGYEDNWSDWSTEAYKEYTNLNEGNYIFRVRSKNIYERVGEEAVFSFRVYPPWYRSSLAFGGYGVLVVLLIWIIVRGYTHRLIKEKEKLERIVEERTHEISEQKDEIATQAAELKSNNDRLVELGQFKEDMTSMIIHDLKNPLSVIIKQGERKASSLAKRMLNLVMNILDVQKFEETDVQLDLTEASINQLINQSVADVQDTIDESNLSIDVHVPKSFKLKMDAELIERVIVNLLTNAIKYAPVSSTLSLKVLENESSELYFSIKDQGPGISKEKQQTIFERYVHVDKKTANRSRSTGLGLTFCKIVIRAHGGQIGVESIENEGALFWFTLPGVSEKTDDIEIEVKTSSTELSDVERALFKQVIPGLQKLKVYQSTEIENILNALNAEEDSGLYNLCQKVINASYNGDEEDFKELLSRFEE